MIKSFNLSPEICQKIEDLAVLVNKNKSQLIEEAVKRYQLDVKEAKKQVEEIVKETNDLRNRTMQKYLEQK